MKSVAQSKFVTLTAVLAVLLMAGTFGSAQAPQGGAAGAQGQGGRQGGAGRQGGPGGGRQGGAPAQQAQGVETALVGGNVYLATAGGFNAAFSVGPDGVVVADTLPAQYAEQLVAAIRRVPNGNGPIRFIFNTHHHPEAIGGNVVVGDAGEIVVAGNFAGQAASQASRSYIWAHENALLRITRTEGTPNAVPVAAWPTDVYFSERRDTFFNGESIMMLHQPNAHTDGDSFVWFRRSDVVLSGDVYQNETFPMINVAEGGSIQGMIDALANLIEIMVPRDKQEGGTMVIPTRGRLADEADVVEYYDMTVIIRDRVQDAIKRGQTLEQVKAARLALDYEGRYGRSTTWTTDQFIEAVYNSLRNPPAGLATAAR
jgi:glyoxylase-like metal-dependent hydrolase (beta-lactamase superfamily II)